MSKEQLKHTELAVKAWRVWVKDKPFQSEDIANGFIEGFNFCLNSKIVDWHDLRKNPKDLPKENKELEITIGTLHTFSNEQATCIERLKKENKELKALIKEKHKVGNDKFWRNHWHSIERNIVLEKENAELKLKLEALDEQTPWKDIKDKSEVIRQLTRAKDIITNLVKFDGSYKDDEEYQCKCELYDKIWEEAEQFLKECEID